MSPTAIAQVRRFNRTIGEAIGITDDRFLGRRRPPGESRVLWEIGVEGADVRGLRRRLGLDSGYVSRVLRSLGRQGLVRIRVDRRDRRVRRATLTRRGRTEREHLDRRSDLLAAGLLRALTAQQRARLLVAMRTVDRLLRASTVRFVVSDPQSADARACLNEYFRELDRRFDTGFDPARSNPAERRQLMRPQGLFLVMYARERAIGCGALKFHGRGPAELRRMWIDPAYRGLGLGERLLAELERRARRHGAGAVRLETNDALREAIALYRRTGYVEVEAFNDEPYAQHWFEKTLTA
jgi:DNA-binding MarR family transcriptional regulator/GNAT superfamily N-acetyltransferase